MKEPQKTLIELNLKEECRREILRLPYGGHVVIGVPALKMRAACCVSVASPAAPFSRTRMGVSRFLKEEGTGQPVVTPYSLLREHVLKLLEGPKARFDLHSWIHGQEARDGRPRSTPLLPIPLQIAYVRCWVYALQYPGGLPQITDPKKHYADVGFFARPIWTTLELDAYLLPDFTRAYNEKTLLLIDYNQPGPKGRKDRKTSFFETLLSGTFLPPVPEGEPWEDPTVVTEAAEQKKVLRSVFSAYHHILDEAWKE